MIIANKLVSHIPFSILLHLEREGVLDPEETNKYMLDDTGTYFPKFKKKMAKYKCNNKECKEYNKEVTGNTHIVYKGHTSTDKGAPCPICGVIREMVFDGLAKGVLAKGNGNIYTG